MEDIFVRTGLLLGQENFPAPLWIAIRQGQKGDKLLIGTWGHDCIYLREDHGV